MTEWHIAPGFAMQAAPRASNTLPYQFSRSEKGSEFQACCRFWRWAYAYPVHLLWIQHLIIITIVAYVWSPKQACRGLKLRQLQLLFWFCSSTTAVKSADVPALILTNTCNAKGLVIYHAVQRMTTQWTYLELLPASCWSFEPGIAFVITGFII